ncbi:MAG: sugar phosphate isomerase/epimerase [Deltaproteobacteria bacterium]|nr:sugar phosphate isomerase/epimerase [Deltaproteobacteria bacterium]MBW2362267.1 sugar phosphate isomerase/epimerase [Deltaproteobacteria bacterium]
MPSAREETLVLCDATLIGGATEITADQLKQIVHATAGAGFSGVSLWALHHLAAVGGGMTDAAVQALHSDAGLSVPIVEALLGWETGDTNTIDGQCTGTLDVAARYGAKTVAGVVLGPSLDSFDAAVSGFAYLGERAAERGLGICVEWLPWTGLPDLGTAWKLVQDTGLDNVGLIVDAWHWLRQPGGPDLETLRQIPGERIHCVQLDDAPAQPPGDDILAETMAARLLPGDGDVDYAALFAVLDEIGADPIWAPEVFNTELLALGPDEMARRIGAATRKLLGL